MRTLFFALLTLASVLFVLGGCSSTQSVSDGAPSDTGPLDAFLDLSLADTGTDSGAMLDSTSADILPDAIDRPTAQDTPADLPADRASDAMQSDDLTVNLQSDGGITGRGSLDYVLRDGVLGVHNPFGSPMDCSGTLAADVRARLTSEASEAIAAGLLPTYRRPDNPMCCCDQFTYMLSLGVTHTDGSHASATTDWCDEAIASLPSALTVFLADLRAAGVTVAASCH